MFHLLVHCTMLSVIHQSLTGKTGADSDGEVTSLLIALDITLDMGVVNDLELTFLSREVDVEVIANAVFQLFEHGLRET